VLKTARDIKNRMDKLSYEELDNARVGLQKYYSKLHGSNQEMENEIYDVIFDLEHKIKFLDELKG
jgi:hypothetical protein